jgi:phosphoglycerate dehydrogenase-like enzyme
MMIHPTPPGTPPRRGGLQSRHTIPKLGHRVPALLMNASFLDVLPRVRQSLDDAGFEVTARTEYLALPDAERRAVLAAAQVLFGPGAFSRADLEHARRLKVISLAASGYESVDVDAATELGIVVTNAPTQLGTESVADLTFGLILDVARGISRADQRLKSGVWQRSMGTTIWNKTLGIIGFGRIGRAVATRARGFSMTVLTLPHHAADPSALELGVQGVAMEELLRRSDFLSLHSRYSPLTHHLIGRAQLQMMKPSAYLINTARAGLVDPLALFEALVSNRIAGVGLDVFDGEPDTRNPLLTLPNVIATPHIGNRTLEGVLDVVECSVRNAVAVLHGQRPEFVVNPAVYERGVR